MLPTQEKNCDFIRSTRPEEKATFMKVNPEEYKWKLGLCVRFKMASNFSLVDILNGRTKQDFLSTAVALIQPPAAYAQPSCQNVDQAHYDIDLPAILKELNDLTQRIKNLENQNFEQRLHLMEQQREQQQDGGI